MFCVVTVRDVQPEIRPEVTRKMRKSFENPPSLRLPAWQAVDYADVTDRGTDSMKCETRMRSRFYVNERSFQLAAETSRLAACAPQSGKLAKAFGVTAGAAERSAFWANYLLAALAAATILSKRGSPRKSSPHGFEPKVAVCRLQFANRRDNIS